MGEQVGRHEQAVGAGKLLLMVVLLRWSARGALDRPGD